MLFDPNHKILDYSQAEEVSQQLKQQGKRIVFVSGVYDLMHAAHAMYLAKARQLGDILLVSVGSDETVTALKGPTRPIVPEEARASMLAALEVVDYVVIAKEQVQLPSKIDYEQLFSLVRPQVLALNDFDNAIPLKTEFAKKYGAELGLIDCADHHFISTTEIEQKIKGS